MVIKRALVEAAACELEALLDKVRRLEWLVEQKDAALSTAEHGFSNLRIASDLPVAWEQLKEREEMVVRSRGLTIEDCPDA